MGEEHQLCVEHVGDDRFTIRVRGHSVFVDQPRDAGGFDTAPSPTELFAGALASCVAFYARRYLARHQLAEDELVVTATYALGGRPARVNEVVIRIDVSDALSADERRTLLAVASHCTVHNTLRQPPVVTIQLAGDESLAHAGSLVEAS
jgi:putative redox protein